MKGRLTIKKIKELDILSGIAIIMVVLIHADRFYVRTVLNLDSYLNAGIGVNILDNLIWAAVPIFIFISGYKYYLNIISTNQNCFYFIKKQVTIQPSRKEYHKKECSFSEVLLVNVMKIESYFPLKWFQYFR